VRLQLLSGLPTLTPTAEPGVEDLAAEVLDESAFFQRKSACKLHAGSGGPDSHVAFAHDQRRHVSEEGLSIT
jgi:hypothetical protein